MKRSRFISLLFTFAIVLCFTLCANAESGTMIFDGDLKNYPGNWNVSVVPEESIVKAVYDSHDSIRGNSVRIDVPANTSYCALAVMDSISADDAPVAVVDLTVMLTDIATDKEIILHTRDEESNEQLVSLLTITNKGALKLGDVTVSTDYFKFGTWTNGHYNIKLYYFAELGKTGLYIQRLKYAKGTPIDKEWIFTASVPSCEVIDGVAFRFDTAASSIRADIFNFNITKLSESNVPESIINSQRSYDFNDLDTMTIKNSQTSGFHTSYYGWYTQNTSTECNVGYAEEDNKKVLNLYTDGTKYLELVKAFDLSLSNMPIIEADIKLAQDSVVGMLIRGPAVSDGQAVEKSLIRFEDGVAKLLNTEELSGFEYDKWFRVSLCIDNSCDAPILKAKLIDPELGIVGEAEAQFDFINTIKYINTFKITPARNKTSVVYIDNISFSVKIVHRITPDFEADSTIYSDEVSFTSTTFNVDKSKSSVRLNGAETELSKIIADEFNKVKIKLDRQAEPYTMEYTFYNYWGDKAEGVISFICPMDSFYDFEYDKNSIEPGTLNCTAKAVCASGKYEKVTMLMVLYDLSDNSMHSIDISQCELSATPVIVSTSVEVPSDSGEYRAVAYLIDDMINMNSLTKSIELK